MTCGLSSAKCYPHLAALSDVRTIRLRLAAIAEATDPVALQPMFAAAMLARLPGHHQRLLRR